jgi:hypothetical protein
VKKLFETVTAILAIGGLMLVGQSWSQQVPPAGPVSGPVKSPPPADPPTVPANGPRQSPNYDIEFYRQRKNKRFQRTDMIEEAESGKAARTIDELLNRLGEIQEKKGAIVSQTGMRASSSSTTTATPETPDEAKMKAELMKQLEAAVAAGFDEDMKVREGELSKLEERLNKLRAQLDRRRKAKGEIIQLEVKVLVNEAEGLGFVGVPSSWSRKGRMGLSNNSVFDQAPMPKVRMKMPVMPDFKRDQFQSRPQYKEVPPSYKEGE